MELLAALHIFQAQFCILSNGDGDVYVPVMIQLWNKKEGKEEGSIISARHGHGSSRESFPICVPPMIAAAVGLYTYQLSTSDGKDVNVSAHKCTFQLYSISTRVPLLMSNGNQSFTIKDNPSVSVAPKSP